ncbi:TRAP transporter permease [Chloroflexota bacterium]
MSTSIEKELSKATGGTVPAVEIAPGRIKGGVAKWIAVSFALIGIVVGGIINFNVPIWNIIPLKIFEPRMIEYFTLGLFVPLLLLDQPLRKRWRGRPIPWYDWLLALVLLGAFFYVAANAYQVAWKGWAASAPLIPLILAGIILGTMLSLAHRQFGIVFFVVIMFFTIYPLFAESIPGVLKGISYSVPALVSQHVFGAEGIDGLPMRVAGRLMISFLPFLAIMLYFGGPRLWVTLALSIIGRFRGGGAKVAVMASALVASISGSSTANVITTGVVTIPLMKRTGYTPHYAGAIESCASTGGVLTPPVMGGVAFIMASFLQISYAQIVIAAIIPAILYYISLFVQVDIYAKRVGLKGLSPEEVPRFWPTLKAGWHIIGAYVVFVYYLVFAQEIFKAGWYAALFLLIVLLYKRWREKRLRAFPGELANGLMVAARLGAQMVTLFGLVGLIIGSISICGVGLAISTSLVSVSGGNLVSLLIIGGLTALVLGMGMTVTAVYVIVALLLAPALVQVGINPIAAHLFVLYWGMLSSITPPVALSALIACRIADSDFLKTALLSCRMGIIIFLIPFLWVLSPNLILQGELTRIMLDLPTAILGIIVTSFGLEGGMWFVREKLNITMRSIVIISGLLILFPSWQTDMYGLIILAGILIYLFVIRTLVFRKVPT